MRGWNSEGGAQTRIDVWEVKDKVVRHAAGRFSLSRTAPPLRGRNVTTTPYALLLLPRRRPPIPPPRSPLIFSNLDEPTTFE